VSYTYSDGARWELTCSEAPDGLPTWLLHRTGVDGHQALIAAERLAEVTGPALLGWLGNAGVPESVAESLVKEVADAPPEVWPAD